MITGADVRGSRFRQSTIDEIRRSKVFYQLSTNYLPETSGLDAD
jgi:hypothetical protein